MLKKLLRSLIQLVVQIRSFVSPKFVVVAIAILLVALLYIYTPLKTVFDPAMFQDSIEQHEGYVELIFIALYTVLTVVGVPATVLTIIGGSLFGLWYGTIISIVSATLGALCAFWMARYLFRDLAQRRLSKSQRLIKYQTAVLEQPFHFVLATRLVPISPYNLVNYLFGLTSINWTDYAMATLVGVIPGCFAYTWIGVSGKTVMMGGDRLSLFLALSFLTLLSIIPLLCKRQIRS